MVLEAVEGKGEIMNIVIFSLLVFIIAFLGVLSAIKSYSKPMRKMWNIILPTAKAVNISLIVAIILTVIMVISYLRH
jgi:hypothetical protein